MAMDAMAALFAHGTQNALAGTGASNAMALQAWAAKKQQEAQRQNVLEQIGLEREKFYNDLADRQAARNAAARERDREFGLRKGGLDEDRRRYDLGRGDNLARDERDFGFRKESADRDFGFKERAYGDQRADVEFGRGYQRERDAAADARFGAQDSRVAEAHALQQRMGNMQLGDMENDPQRMLRGLQSNALREALGQPPREEAPSAPAPSLDLKGAPFAMTADASNEPVFGGAAPAASVPSASPNADRLMAATQNPVLRKLFGMPSLEDEMAKKAQREREQKLFDLKMAETERELRGEMSPNQKRDRHVQEVGQAMKLAQDYQLQYKLPPAEAAARALAVVNPLRQARGEAALAPTDLQTMDLPVDTSPGGVSQAVQQLGLDPDAAYTRALDSVVAQDPEMGSFAHRLTGGMLGSKWTTAKDALVGNTERAGYETLNKAKTIQNLINMGMNPRQAAAFVSRKLAMAQ